MLVRALVSACIVAGAAEVARAGPAADLASARAIGHAGASLVSDDGLGALFACPAGLARRDERRAQLGAVLTDDDVRFTSGAAPAVGDRGPSALAPTVVAAGGLGRLVVGVGVATTEQLDHRLPAPGPDDGPAIAALYPHRYAGTAARHRRRTAAVAAAWRVTDWLAIGASASLAQVDVGEARRVWAGFDGRDRLADAARDATVSVDGHDALVPGAAIGALIAPASLPLELAVGAAWSADVDATGDASVRSHGPFTVDADGARASLAVASPLALHAGARWLGERFAVEAGVSAWLAPGGAATWRLDGVRFVDESGVDARLERLPSRLRPADRLAARAAVDVEALTGWLWLTAGYGYAIADLPAATTTTTGLDPGGHTLAVGVEIAAGPATISVGVSRKLDRAVTVGGAGLAFDNPFAGGTAPANLGRHAHARDLIAFALELALR